MKTNTLTQITVELQHLVHLSQDLLPASLQKPFKRLIYRADRAKGWLLGSVGLLLLWIWLWQWVLSLAIGLAVMVGVYLAQQRQLKVSWQGWHKLWNRPNRSLSVSVLAGVVALGSTYLTTAVWLETDQHWLATSILLEGCGVLAILAMMLWQWFDHQSGQQEQVDTLFQQWLTELSHSDPLKRMIAVRQTTRHLLTASANASVPITPGHLIDCFRLMLDRETEPLVCSALIESLQALNPVRQLEETRLSSVSMRTPTKTKVAQQFSTDED